MRLILATSRTVHLTPAAAQAAFEACGRLVPDLPDGAVARLRPAPLRGSGRAAPRPVPVRAAGRSGLRAQPVAVA